MDELADLTFEVNAKGLWYKRPVPRRTKIARDLEMLERTSTRAGFIVHDFPLVGFRCDNGVLVYRAIEQDEQEITVELVRIEPPGGVRMMESAELLEACYRRSQG